MTTEIMIADANYFRYGIHAFDPRCIEGVKSYWWDGDEDRAAHGDVGVYMDSGFRHDLYFSDKAAWAWVDEKMHMYIRQRGEHAPVLIDQSLLPGGKWEFVPKRGTTA